MPILFVVKPSRRRLYETLRRLVSPGLVGVVLERRHRERLVHPAAAVARCRGFTMRQPLDGDSARTWARLGFLVVKVRALPGSRPADAGSPGRRVGAPRSGRAGGARAR
jgi:hypothetical protein